MESMDSLTTIFSHNLWANRHLLERCAQLTSEQLEAAIPGAYGSIWETLEHIVSAERSYFSRISTGQPFRRPKDTLALTFPEMIESIQMSGQGLVEWANQVKPGDTVQVDWDSAPRDVPKGIILTQVINHATEHRAQVMAIMTQLGIEPPDLQGWAYFDTMDA
jgi:uncharacterized damage-inducible protein DinB